MITILYSYLKITGTGSLSKLQVFKEGSVSPCSGYSETGKLGRTVTEDISCCSFKSISVWLFSGP